MSKSKTYKSLKDIPEFIGTRARYEVDVSWVELEAYLDHKKKSYGLDLNPDFQREHVWTLDQRIAYVEFSLRGGRSARTLQWNAHDWDQSTGIHPLQIVDGKQRLTSVLMFLHDEVPAFGRVLSEYEDELGWSVGFRFCINSLPTKAEVLQWYLELNSGGTIHTDAELNKVRRMLKKEKKNENPS